MMIKIYIVLLLTLLSGYKIYAQQIIVVDSLEKTPLSFVAVTYEGGGFYTNEAGRFNPNNVQGESYQLSLLGYKSKSIAKMSLKDTILLSLNPTALDEVFVNNQLEKTIIYKKPKKTNFFGSAILSRRTRVYLILIPDSAMLDSKVDNLMFYFRKGLGMQSDRKEALENIDAFIRINIHEVENEKPANHIYASDPIKISALNKDEFVLDLKYDWITIPKEGISISIEMIGYYDQNYNELTDRGYVRPMLTPEKYEHFKAITYKHFPFRTDGDKMILMSDFLKQMGAETKHIDRNLAIGMTLSQY